MSILFHFSLYVLHMLQETISEEELQVSFNYAELRKHATLKKCDRLNHVNRLPVHPAAHNQEKFRKTYLNKEKKLLSSTMLLYYLAAIFK
uniref:Uncharacterized protein n=1 Tax=Romanomermis culicivorax TaxID=13658 RepID=A0A915HQ22_ROMCU